MSEPIREVVARSSLGGHAWCSVCRHPDLNHKATKPFAEKRGRCQQPGCDCVRLRRMTPAEWLRWTRRNQSSGFTTFAGGSDDEKPRRLG